MTYFSNCYGADTLTSECLSVKIFLFKLIWFTLKQATNAQSGNIDTVVLFL